MKLLLGSAVLIIEFFIRVYLQELHNENIQNSKHLLAVSSFSEENETGIFGIAAGTSSETKSQLSDETLVNLFNTAKSISHSKGIYQKSDKTRESEDETEIRRSIHRKAVITSASDVMKSILNTIKSGVKKLSLLEHLEHLVHEFEVAVNFADQGGIQIISPLLFLPNDDFASAAALVLGSAMQSNPVVQKLAAKYNVGGNLLKLLSHESPVVLSRVIFALGAFLRNAPKAQEEFIAMKGVSKLAMVLKNPKVLTSTKLKIITLFSDLVVEKQTDEHNSSNNFLQISSLERLLASELENNGICKFIPAFLDVEGIDAHQKTVSAMISLQNVCGKNFQSEEAVNKIKKLLSAYNPDMEDTLYSAINMDLRKMLHSELKVLLNNISKVKNPDLGKSEL